MWTKYFRKFLLGNRGESLNERAIIRGKNSGSLSNIRGNFNKIVFVNPNITYSSLYSPVVGGSSTHKVDQNDSLHSTKLPAISKDEKKVILPI